MHTDAFARGNPKAKYAAERNPHPGKGARVIRKPPEPQPKANKNWHPFVQSWWNAWGKSDLADIAQAADWMLAWTAAEVLDQMYQEGRFTASLVHEWRSIVASLHAPRFDLLDAEPEAAVDKQAQEDAELDAAIIDIRDRLYDSADGLDDPSHPRWKVNGDG